MQTCFFVVLLTCLLDVFIDVFAPCRGVRDIIVGHEVDLRSDQRSHTVLGASQKMSKINGDRC